MECSMPDLEQVRGFLRASCSSDVSLDELEATYVQAGASGPTRVLYELRRRDGDVVRVTARRVERTKARRIQAAINAQSRGVHDTSAFAQAALYAPDLDLLFQIFPVDQRLPSLPVAVNADRMLGVLQTAFERAGVSGRPQSVIAQVMRYKPERKCLLRYDLTWNAHDRDDVPHHIWARVARRSKFERSRDNLRRIAAAAEGLGFDLPEPLGVFPELDMELLGPVPGVALFTLTEREAFPEWCRRTGTALRRFHALSVQVSETFDADSQSRRLSENATEFAWLWPERVTVIRRLATALAIRLEATRRRPLSLIHRDFHGDNVLVCDGRLALLDFEDCAMGEPADDVGSNWAQLTWHMHRCGARHSAARGAFIEGYLETADAGTARQLPTYAALHCFLYAHQCLRHPQDPRRLDDAHAMLAVCQDVLDRGLP